MKIRHINRGVVALLLALPLPALAQQFVEETASRLPQPGPKEYTHQITLGDVDADQDLDIIVINGNAYDKPSANASAHQTRLYLNNGSGVFTDASDQLDLPPGWYRDGDLADLDGDGDLDLAMAGAFGFEPKLLINDGTGNFTDETEARAPVFAGEWGAAIAAGDVDMDGDLDLYLTNAGTKMFGTPGGQDRLWINKGAGKFEDQTATRLPDLVTRATIQCMFEDIDNDGDLDVLVTNRDIKSNLLLNDGTGRFSNASFLLVPDGGHTYSIQAGDLNADGLTDLLLTNGASSGTKELLMVNSFDGSSAGFVDATDLLMGAPGANPNADDNELELFDVDSDGDMDVVIAAISPGAERVLLNDGDGFLTLADEGFDGPSDATLDLEIGDLDGDGRPDVVTAQGESGDFTNRVYMNTGPVDSQAPMVDNVRAATTLGAYLGPVPVVARIRDAFTSDTGPRLLEVTLDGAPMRWAGGSSFWATTGAGLIKAPFSVKVTATDPQGNAATSGPVTISPKHPLDVFEDGVVDDTDLNIMIDHLLDNGGLGDIADLDRDGEVDLSDAQLLASGLGGAPVLTRAAVLFGGQWLFVGANFGDNPTAVAGDAAVTVSDSGPISILATIVGVVQGNITINVGGEPSNSVEVQ